MKGNTDKCHFIIISNDSSEIKIGNSLIKRSNCEKLLAVMVDTKLTFDDHNKDLCRKAAGCTREGYSIYGSCKKEITNDSLFCCTV